MRKSRKRFKRRGRSRKSVMGHSFSQVPQANIQRSTFNRSHAHKTTFDEGYLIPILVDEALPGDTFKVRMSAFARLATPIFPIMDNLRMDTHFFAVPNRLVWDNWQKFNGEKDNPSDSEEYVVPHLAATPQDIIGTIYDYMGLPNKAAVTQGGVNTLHLRAYNLIWNEWFRDQNLQNSVIVNKGNTGDDFSHFNLLRRGKRHDYFTSCLPWPQKGEAVSLPLGLSAPLSYGNKELLTTDAPANSLIGIKSSIDSLSHTSADFGTLNDNAMTVRIAPAGNELYTDLSGGIADLTDATTVTINELRQSFQIQKLLERDARGGTRYTEIVKSHFGVTSPDARLQRPEYLGGGSQPIIVTPIEQTSETTASSPQGNLAAYGTGVVNGNGFIKSFTEHCVIIGLVSVRADLTYQEGLDRMWSRRTRYDYYWPSLSHIGEQAVLNKEIENVNNATANNVFGYQERYAEYRYKPSKITGKFRSSAPDSLDAWHLSQTFDPAPALGATFIQETPPVGRVVAVAQNQPHFLFDSFFDMICTRPMPTYAIPGKIDHF